MRPPGPTPCDELSDCQTCNSAVLCEADAGQDRTRCQLAAEALGSACKWTCCPGCCDGNNNCAACLVFVTSGTYPGDLGGLDVADTICQSRPQHLHSYPKPLPGTYKAWLSNSTNSPATRFRCRDATCSAKGYQRVDGVTIAADWADLTTCDGPSSACLQNIISRTENNAPAGLVDKVWTGTETDGTGGNAHCENWTAGFPSLGIMGDSLEDRNGHWTHIPQGRCEESKHLYCFQQS